MPLSSIDFLLGALLYDIDQEWRADAVWSTYFSVNERKELEATLESAAFYVVNPQKKSTNLESLLHQVAAGKQAVPKRLNLEPLSINCELEARGTGRESTLWELYSQAIEGMIALQLPKEKFCLRLFSLTRQYLSRVPNLQEAHSLISQYDFVKCQAAFASCLNTDKFDYPFLMACVDLSGVQSFIYDIHSKRAAMSLKGRSFYLTLLLDAIIRRILELSSVTPANVIYSSGGKAYLLLPAGVEAELQRFEDKLQANLFDAFQGELYAVIDSVPFNLFPRTYQVQSPIHTPEGEAPNGLADLWRTVSFRTGERKQRKFDRWMQNEAGFATLFTGKLEKDLNGTGKAICAVSGRPTGRIAQHLLFPLEEGQSEEEGTYVIPLVKKQYELGKQLREGRVLRRCPVEAVPKSEDHLWGPDPLGLGIRYRLGQSGSVAKPAPGEDVELVNPEQGEDLSHFSAFVFYGGNQQALKHVGTEDEALKEYSDLAEPEAEKDLRRLGILRMDVDNLGKVFENPLQSNEPADISLPIYSSLSAQLDWFFTGYINRLRNGNTYRDHVNVLYAGGDDLFAVGRWDKIIDFAWQLRQDFQTYVTGTAPLKRITLSAGIELVSPKFPISKGAEMAGEALDQAKSFYLRDEVLRREKNDPPDKDALHLLGTTVSWHEEFGFVQQLREVFGTLLAADTISKGFIYKLFTFQKAKDDNDLSWWWESAYLFSRYRERARKQENRTAAAFFEAATVALATHRFDAKPPRGFEWEGKDKSFSHQAPTTERMLDLMCLAAKLADYDQR